MKTNPDFRIDFSDLPIEKVGKKKEDLDNKPLKKNSPGRQKLEKWLNYFMKIEMTDGRTLVGSFVCSDKDSNIILSSCTEHLKPDEDGREEEPRVLGLAMVPGRHIVSICIDQSSAPTHQIII